MTESAGAERAETGFVSPKAPGPSAGLDAAVERVARRFAQAGRAYRPALRVREEGRIDRVADGVVRIGGLPGAQAEEILRVGPHARALVLGLDRAGLDAVLLDEMHAIRRGTRVRRTGAGPALPVGVELVGRVIDPLSRPLDGLGMVRARTSAPLECVAPQMHERDAVHKPLYTGVLALDAMLPIGRGQRELILGDEGSGKTALAVDVLLRQARTEVVGVYVAVGRRRAETWRLVETLRAAGGRWVVVAAFDDQSPGLRYLAPYAGCAVAEYFMRRGEHALVVYDDLTAHALAWRELSLLMRRPPGREAFPGDVFYLHARLLERGTQLSVAEGGGSLTALPLCTLESGRLSAYLPTNLISITDGQVVLSSKLFAAGQRPAVDVGLSVSRVGGKAQAQALRELSAELRLAYASFLELEVFTRVGARLEPTVERRLAYGARLRSLLRQPCGQPLSVFDEVVRIILMKDEDSLCRLPVDAVPAIARELAAHLLRSEPAHAERVERDGVLPAAGAAQLRAAIRAWLATRFASDPARPASEPAKVNAP